MTAVTEPRNAASQNSRTSPGGGGRRSLVVALLLGVAGASIVLLAAGKTWMHASTAAGATTIRVSATGSEATGLPGALALVGLAALVAVFAVRGVGRMIVSGLLALSGAGAIAGALVALGDDTALDEAASKATSLAHATVGGTSVTLWPVVAAAGGTLLLTAGIIALARGRAWPGMSNRYDRDGAEPRVRKQRKPVVDPDRPEDLWKALDRGEDPTEG